MKSLYVPYKVVGYVIDSNPFSVNRLGDETFITTSIGKAFQVYRFDQLVVCLVSRSATGSVTAFQVLNTETFAAVDNVIHVYDRNCIVRTYKEHDRPILGLCLVGTVLLSFDDNNTVKIIDVKGRELIGELNLLQPAQITHIMHPATYLNKFIFAFANCELELWNIRTCSLIYTFLSHKTFLSKIDSLEPNDKLPAITCIEQSPACDVVGVGFSTGDILLMHLKLDKVLFSFAQDQAVTSLSFRTDIAAEKFPLMASGSADGRVHVWHLGGGSSDNVERRLLHSLDDAHGAKVTKVHFVHGEPLLVTSGADNALKVWIFDAPDGSARLLRSREGPSGELQRVRHYGGDTEASMREAAEALSCEMVCTADDGSLRVLNSALPAQSRELSQQTVLKKLGMQRRNVRLPVITGFDFSETRQRDWGNLVTIHKNHSNAYVWRYKHRTVSDVILRQPHWESNEMMYQIDRSTHATAISVSCCGNFCTVGSRGGTIYMYNLQSGLPRGAFPASAEQSTLKAGTIKTRASTPGNVLHERKAVLAQDGPPVGKGSLKAMGTSHVLSSQEIREEVPKITGHKLEVTGLFLDPCNGVLVSCSLDGMIIFWDMSSHELLQVISNKHPQLRLVPFRDGGFVAVVGQDRVIRVYDLASRKLSRRFDGHSREVSDMAFTPDGRRLLSSSLDCTVRVWDLPTGRCLSWMRFDSPVLSVGVSLSGDQMSLVLTDRVGVHTYVDRSLYETVHFWNEPKEPSWMNDCEVINDELPVQGDAEDAEELRGEEEEDNKRDGEGEGEGEGGQAEGAMEVHPTQGQVEAETAREAQAQRAAGVITLSVVPKAYWTTLFRLEEIKARNKVKEAPKAPEQAPFFLPTVVREGATPSFPTPQEYKKMMASTNSSSINENSGDKITKKGVLGGRDEDGDEAAGASKKMRQESGGSAAEEDADEADLAAALGALGSVWDDEDDEVEVGEEVESAESTMVSPRGEKEPRRAGSKTRTSTWLGSRILRREASLPRCTLAALLWRAYPSPSTSTSTLLSKTAFLGPRLTDDNSSITAYLTSLAPPAVDLEFRALCPGAGDSEGDGDTEGVQLVLRLLTHLASSLQGATNFELYQAYLHRCLAIHAHLILREGVLGSAVRRLQDAQSVGCERLRELVHSNLCLLKLMSKVPPT